MADARRKCIDDASGVRTKAAPGGPGRPTCGMSDGGIDAGEAGGVKPPRRVSGGRCGRSRRQSCAARCRRRRRSGPHWCGHDCPARCGAKCGRVHAGTPARAETPAARGVPPRRAEARPAAGEGRARRAPRRARRAAPSRGGHDGHRHKAVEPRQERVGSATAASAASRRASGARSERSERRREGYPPEGPRPRSGLGRVARSRSDAPRLIVCIGEPESIFGTIGIITTCITGIGNTVTVVCTNGVDIVDSITVKCRDARLMSGRA